MNNRAAVLLLALAITLMSIPGVAANQPLERHSAFASFTLAGSTRFRFLGLDIYDASLWVEPGFKASEYERHGFALELTYLRDLTNQAITHRSMDEMRRLAIIPELRLRAWQRLLRNAFADVRKGDRITGINRPGVGVVFMTNGQTTGDIRDTEFARLFFGIWLSAQTSEPALREALLAQMTAR